MKKLSTMMAVLALLATACDPYEDEPGGDPQILSVSVPRTAIEDTEADTEAFYDLANVPTSRVAFFVTTNQLLDGSLIQTAPQNPSDTQDPGDCTPANDWITVTKDGAAVPLVNDGVTGRNWYTCYYPSAATANYGASVMIFRAATPPGFTGPSSPLSTGTLDDSAEYEITGVVQTTSGADLPINIRISSLVAAPAVLEATIDGPTSVTLTWTAVATQTSYTVSRAPVDAEGTVGEYAVLAADLPAGTDTYTDTTVTGADTDVFAYKVETTGTNGTVNSSVVRTAP